MQSRIVFQNQDLVAVIKKPGELTVPGRFQGQDDRQVLGHRLQKELNKMIFPVHRLDCEVGGLVLFALNPQSHRVAQSWFEKKQISKSYSAISLERDFKHWPQAQAAAVDSRPMDLESGQSWLWTSQILRGKKRSFISPHGDRAETQVFYLNCFSGDDFRYHHWLLKPLTGRSHQLRLEMSRHGFPLVGDVLYGGSLTAQDGLKKKTTESVQLEDPWIGLWAFQLDFTHVKNRMGLPQVIEMKDPWAGNHL